jgi:hypothetical protein
MGIYVVNHINSPQTLVCYAAFESVRKWSMRFYLVRCSSSRLGTFFPSLIAAWKEFVVAIDRVTRIENAWWYCRLTATDVIELFLGHALSMRTAD